jgi:hypothetical protein
MPYKNKTNRIKCSSSHYLKYKSYYSRKAREWNEKYRTRNANFVNRVKRIFGCKSCGYKKCVSALEFHHRDASKKDDSISLMVLRCSSLKRIKDEIRKCDILCANCHREFHAG